MNDSTQYALKAHENTLWLCYLLYILFVTAPIGAAIAFVQHRRYRANCKQEESCQPRTVRAETHYKWLLQTFFVTVLLLMMSLGTAYYMFGFVIGLMTLVWWAYRLVKGMLMLVEHRPMPIAI